MASVVMLLGLFYCQTSTWKVLCGSRRRLRLSSRKVAMWPLLGLTASKNLVTASLQLLHYYSHEAQEAVVCSCPALRHWDYSCSCLSIQTLMRRIPYFVRMNVAGYL
ncbi:hypothetical protein F5Y19DRAFT_456308 [Xylariaceae sp. FL1651]|nr:hypothetical protein F5Y19DRAFT_456308 [Xylariaceae sp. FL1651]